MWGIVGLTAEQAVRSNLEILNFMHNCLSHPDSVISLFKKGFLHPVNMGAETNMHQLHQTWGAWNRPDYYLLISFWLSFGSYNATVINKNKLAGAPLASYIVHDWLNKRLQPIKGCEDREKKDNFLVHIKAKLPPITEGRNTSPQGADLRELPV